jgi:hypothetical protein
VCGTSAPAADGDDDDGEDDDDDDDDDDEGDDQEAEEGAMAARTTPATSTRSRWRQRRRRRRLIMAGADAAQTSAGFVHREASIAFGGAHDVVLPALPRFAYVHVVYVYVYGVRTYP